MALSFCRFVIRAAADTPVIELRSFSRFGLAALAAVCLGATLGLAPASAADVDPSKMSSDEIEALEHRLTDAGCYKGKIDGTTRSALRSAIRACPDQQAFLRIETGMHTAAIKRIAVDSGARC